MPCLDSHFLLYHHYSLASVFILTVTAFLKLLLVLPTGSGLPCSHSQRYHWWFLWDFSYFTLCYNYMCFILSPFSINCLGSITMFCSSLRPLQCQSQFLKHNKYSIIIHLLDWVQINSFSTPCWQNNYNKFIITVRGRARIWTWALYSWTLLTLQIDRIWVATLLVQLCNLALIAQT